MRTLSAVGLVLAMVVSVSAQEPKKEATPTPSGDGKVFAWKFEKDVPFYQEMYTKTVQTMKVMGQDVNQVQEQTFYFKWTPVKSEAEKWTLKQTIEGVKMKIDVAGNPISFDSTVAPAPGGGANSALSEFFKALVGSEFTIVLNTKTNKVEKVEGRDAFIAKLAAANQQMEPILKKILPEDALKQMADPTFGVIPEGAKKKDETWKGTSVLALGPIGTYENNYTYKYVGTDEKAKAEKIEVETQITYKAPTGDDTGLPFKIKSANLSTKDKQTPGVILFDIAKGRLVSSDNTLKLSGTISIEIGTTSTSVELIQDQETKVKTSDTSLIQPKK
jgi:hypothetical protein